MNPLATRATALLWIGVWRIGDIVSTFAAREWAVAGSRELNPIMNWLAGHVGFTVAVLLIAPVPLLIVHRMYHRAPAIVEGIALFFPFIVVGNLLTLVSYRTWSIWAVVSVGAVAGYLVYAVLVDYRRSASLREWLFTVRIADPVLWTPQGDTR